LKTPAALFALALASVATLTAADPLKELSAASEAIPTTPSPRIKRVGIQPAPSVSPAAKPAATPAPYRPAVRRDGRRVVALDIGHTAAQQGAYSARGRGEFLFNKDIVEALSARLRDHPQIAPFIINPEGIPISLPMRTALAAKNGAELFLAIHHDSAQDKYFSAWEFEGKPQRFSDDFHGYGVFVSDKNRQPARSLVFGKLLGAEMAKAGFEFSPHHAEPVRGENRAIIDNDRGVYRYNDLIVLKTAPMPAALLECGVIANREEEARLRDPATHGRIVESIVAAIERFFASEPAAPR
jgi:N-acetylmuramoyl-L-alanine amidase